jgi:two-component system phosphate regulon sensor histidine kinase PhoR
MKRPLLFKLFLGFLACTGILSLSILLFSFWTTQKLYTNCVEEELGNTGRAFIPLARTFLDDQKTEELERHVHEISEETGIRITIIDTEGIVLTDSDVDPAVMDNHRNRPEIAQALTGIPSSSKRYSISTKQNMLYVALPIKSGAETKAVLRLSRYLESLNNLVQNLNLKLFIFTASVLAVSLAFSLLFANRLMKPVQDIGESVQNAARGDFSKKVFLPRNHTLKRLADNYNSMLDEIKRYVEELSQQKEELRAIISAMQPGLLVLNESDTIVLTNKSLDRITPVVNIRGEKYWKIFKEPALFELVRNAQFKKVTIVEDIRIDHKYYQISAAFLPSTNETVLVFHDITGIKKLENMKRDLVQNVSHELRTPLTAIKGYAETIEGKNKETRQYLDIIKRHTDRLISIVEDLLILSELEAGGHVIEREKVNLKVLIEHVLKIFSTKIDSKGISLVKEFGKQVPLIRGDPLRLEQVIINLLDNSIKHTENGEIRIGLARQESELLLTVADTGIGIPKEHHERIFERFYTVDKSRSRRLGGTGLGLSIVKHIVQIHDGTITLDSTPGAGTVFTIRFPIAGGSGRQIDDPSVDP